MWNHPGICFARGATHKILLLLLVSALSLASVSPATAQKEKKKKTDASSSSDTSKPLIPLTDEQQIDYTLSDMLGAWQLGDIEKLHKDYADDVAMVNGWWAPPIFGWTNYLAIYQQQRARMTQVRMDRFNTYIKVSGAVGWACYQLDFRAVVDGQLAQSQGHTTVVLVQREKLWHIVLNNSSDAQKLPPPTTARPP